MIKFSIILAALCILTFSSCGRRTDGTDRLSDTAMKSSAVGDTQETTEGFVLPELSDDIPAEAMTKKTETKFYNDKFEHNYIDYIDEHGNSLMLIMTNDDSSEETIVSNSRYEYNDDGNIIHDYSINNKEEVLENFYKYDENGNCIIDELRINGKPEIISENVYDRYNNKIQSRTSDYEHYSSIPSTEYPNYNNLEYDGNGNITTICLDDSIYLSKTYTYDDKNRILSETNLYSDDSLYARRIRYEYDPVCGEISLEENIEMPDQDTENIISTIKKTYDEKGRIIREEGYYNTDAHTEMTEFEYEDLKQAE